MRDGLKLGPLLQGTEDRYGAEGDGIGVLTPVHHAEIEISEGPEPPARATALLIKAVFDDVAAVLPEAKRTSMKAEIASHILVCAAKGERNPTALKIAALSAVVECSHYSHYISPERRAV